MSLNNLTLIEPEAVSKVMKIKMKFADTRLILWM